MLCVVVDVEFLLCTMWCCCSSCVCLWSVGMRCFSAFSCVISIFVLLSCYMDCDAFVNNRAEY
jgi:hypothetical protein